MNVRWRVVLVSVAVVLAAIGGWYWWRARRVELYGGVQPFMRTLRSLEQATAAELARSQKLPEDYDQMERLCQDAQDIFAVFKNDPREKDPRFGPLAIGMTRLATKLEHDWDNGTRVEAQRTLTDLASACNACHRQLADGKPPVISPEPKTP